MACHAAVGASGNVLEYTDIQLCYLQPQSVLLIEFLAGPEPPRITMYLVQC